MATALAKRKVVAVDDSCQADGRIKGEPVVAIGQGGGGVAAM
jgi:hypothetical protein